MYIHSLIMDRLFKLHICKNRVVYTHTIIVLQDLMLLLVEYWDIDGKQEKSNSNRTHFIRYRRQCFIQTFFQGGGGGGGGQTRVLEMQC